jgi:hypothetical protein
VQLSTFFVRRAPEFLPGNWRQISTGRASIFSIFSRTLFGILEEAGQFGLIGPTIRQLTGTIG